MNHYKSKFVAISLSAMITLSSITMPSAFAAKKILSTTEAAKFLEEVGVLEGDNGNLMLDNKLSRQDAVVLLSRLLGLESQAKAYPTKTMTFKDIKDSFYAPYVSWAQDNGLVNGYSDTKFGYGDYLTAWQTKALMVRSLGYSDTSDEEIEQMAELLGVSDGSTVDSSVSITRADMALLAYNTVQAETIKNTVLGEDLGLFEPAEQPVLTDVKTSSTTTSDDSVTISGKVTPANSDILIGDETASVDEDGNFEIEVFLSEGENLFDVVAKNGYKTDVIEVKVDKADGESGNKMSAQVASDDSIKVTFTSPVSDTSKLDFMLKNEGEISVDVTWSEDKKEVILQAPSTLLEGSYTLTVSGIELTDGKDSVSLVIAENGVSKVEILGEAISLTEFSGESDGDGDLVLSYKLYDKYGVDITDEISDSEIEVVGVVDLEGSKYDIDSTNGKIYFDVAEGTEELEIGDSISVTIISKETGASTSKILKISDKSQVDKIDIKGIEYKDEDIKKILVKESTAAYINIEVFDQNGVEITDEDIMEEGVETLYIVSDSNVIVTPEEYSVDDNTKLRLVVNTSNLSTAKNVTVTIVSKFSGKSASTTLQIKEGSKPDVVKIGAAEQMVAEGDEDYSLILPINVYDQDGVALTSDEVISAYEDGDISVSGSGTLQNASLKLMKTGTNKGKIVNTDNIDDEGTGVVTVTTSTNVATTTISVKEKAYAKTLKVDKEPAANLLDGAVTTYNYKFYDQYNRIIENPSSAYKVKLESSNIEIAKVNFTDTNASAVSPEDSVKITSEGDEGTATISASLYKSEKESPTFPADYSVISKIKTTVAVTKGVPSSLIFSIEEIPTLVSIDGDDGAVDGDDKYARSIKITAKDASGKTYAIPDSRIIRVVSENATDSASDSDKSKYIMISESKVNGDIENQDGYYVVSARELDDINWDDKDTVTTNVKVMIATDTGVKEVSQKITVSKTQPKAEKLIFVYMPDGGSPIDVNENPYNLDPESEMIEEIIGTVDNITDQKIYVYSQDQYGVYKAESTSEFRVINTDRYDGSTIDYDGDYTLEDFSENDIVKDKEVYLMYETSNGVYGTIKIIATDGAGDF